MISYSASQIKTQSAHRYKTTRGGTAKKATTPSLEKIILTSTVVKYTLTTKQTYFVKEYSNKDKVKEIQQLLNLSGVLDKKILEDGSFGDGTEKALKKFQKKYGLVADGIVDTQTLAALRACAGITTLTAAQKDECIKRIIKNLEKRQQPYIPRSRVHTKEEQEEYERLLNYKPKPVDPDYEGKGLSYLSDVYEECHLPDKNSDNVVNFKNRRGDDTFLEKNTYDAYQAMVLKAYYDGIDLNVSVGARSYDDQYRLWKEYTSGQSNVVAAKPPGPHQTGQAIDIYLGYDNIEIMSHEMQQKTAEFKWLHENAEKFGFYGFSLKSTKFESWHWLYNPKD